MCVPNSDSDRHTQQIFFQKARDPKKENVKERKRRSLFWESKEILSIGIIPLECMQKFSKKLATLTS